MSILVVVFFYVVLSILVGVYAWYKGRSGAGFFLLSLLLTPVIGFVIALVSRPDSEAIVRRTGKQKCSKCGKYAKRGARACRHCGNEFPLTTGDEATR